MKNGWHKISGFSVYVENGKILRGIKEDRNGSPVTAYVYRHSKNGGWDKEDQITVDAFRAAYRRGTVGLF